MAAWALQALRDCCEVDLLTYSAIDLDALNGYFGTSLRSTDFRVVSMPASHQRLLRVFPTRGALLEVCLAMRAAARIADRYDIAISTNNEIDFGVRGIQYIHYPTLLSDRPELELRWFHRLPRGIELYRWFCRTLSGLSEERLRSNLTLVNSTYTGELARQALGAQPEVLYPPAKDDFPQRRWAERRDAIVGIGRLNRHKFWHEAWEAVRLLRARGRDIRLTIIGTPDDPPYVAELRGLQAASGDWFRIASDVSREELTRLVSEHRYGLHPMRDEHFGIAVAELLHAGCIPFAHDSGGPPEIVGYDARLCFRSAEEAAEKIDRVAGDAALQIELRQALAARASLFTAERFMQQLQRIVAQWMPAEAAYGTVSAGTAMARNSSFRSISSP